MPPENNDGLKIILQTVTMGKDQWRELLDLRLELVLPLLRSYALPTLGDMLKFNPGPHSRKVRDGKPSFSDGYGPQTRSIFSLHTIAKREINTEEEVRYRYWGITNKKQWLEIRVCYTVETSWSGSVQRNLTYQYLERVKVNEVSFEEVLAGATAESLCDMLDEAVEGWKQKYRRLTRVVAEFDEQNRALELAATPA